MVFRVLRDRFNLAPNAFVHLYFFYQGSLYATDQEIFDILPNLLLFFLRKKGIFRYFLHKVFSNNFYKS